MSAFSRAVYSLLLAGLLYCSLSYQISRFGVARREVSGKPLGSSAGLVGPDARSVTILVPSYREEPRVVMMTMLSAALAQYPNRRIVLLIDDPPQDHAALAATYSALHQVRQMLDVPMQQLQREVAAWRARVSAQAPFDEMARLAACYRLSADWLDETGRRFEADITAEFAHVDRFFIDSILGRLSERYRREAEHLAGARLDPERVAAEYERLATLFCTDITAFERKRFANLSHAPNKAMNLNAYIGLMGGRYRFREGSGDQHIEAALGGECDLEVPSSDYLLTLDADSVILAEYLLDLVGVLESESGVAVAQTPYLTFPGATASVERIAGATTDIQYLVHQGSTYFGASYWVGANALIRFAALKDIVREQVESGYSHRVFIQDETVIEDTGSTIDLLGAGWSVHNHFATLAYSATPADFGALGIQRKRWSNGGLILLPALLHDFLANRRSKNRAFELLLRSNYLLSPAVGNTAVFLLMVWCSVEGRTLVWTPLIMLPYFVLYGRDLKRLGYRFRDVFAVCALNLILMPVGFAGVGASIRQIITGRKASFARTPKVSDRTFVPPQYFLFNLGMMLLMLAYTVQGIGTRDYVGSIIPATNVCLYSYGLTRFIGLRNGFSDLFLLLGEKLARIGFQVAAAWRGLVEVAGAVRRGSLAPVVFVLAVMTPLRIGPDWLEGDMAQGSVHSEPRQTLSTEAPRPPSPLPSDTGTLP